MFTMKRFVSSCFTFLVIFSLFFATALGLPSSISAQGPEPWDPNTCTIDGVATIQGLQCMLGNIFSVAITFIGLAAFVMLIIGAFGYMLSGGNSKGTEQARTTITFAVVGIVVSLSAFIILNFVALFTGVGEVTNFFIPESGNGSQVLTPTGNRIENGWNRDNGRQLTPAEECMEAGGDPEVCIELDEDLILAPTNFDECIDQGTPARTCLERFQEVSETIDTYTECTQRVEDIQYCIDRFENAYANKDACLAAGESDQFCEQTYGDEFATYTECIGIEEDSAICYVEFEDKYANEAACLAAGDDPGFCATAYGN